MFDGILKAAVEVSKNSYDLTEKLEKLAPTGVYSRWCGRGVVLNLVVSGSDERQLQNQFALAHSLNPAASDQEFRKTSKTRKTRKSCVGIATSLGKDREVVGHPDMFHFIKSENNLYQGTQLLVGNVVEDLGGCSTLSAEDERVSAENLKKALRIASMFRCKEEDE